jgi:hypothetical protein
MYHYSAVKLIAPAPLESMRMTNSARAHAARAVYKKFKEKGADT